MKPRSWLHPHEVIMKDVRELLAVGHPVRRRRVVLQALDPVAVELMDGRVDAVALEPAVPERAAVAERRVRAAFSEPCMPAQQLLEDRHPLEMALQLRHGRPA